MVLELELARAMGTAGLFLCLGLAAFGSAMGMMRAARAAIGVLSEEPRYFSLVSVLVFLPMTQTLVYGFGFFILANDILAKSENLTIPLGVGVGSLAALFVGFAELSSAYAQGCVCADVIAMLPKTRGAILVRGLILAAYLEFIGLLGLALGYMLLMISGLVS
ncbi:MAG: hypothetical protein QXS85_01900 [Acidilobaceae archaeon]